jgi:hypothetical protein
VIGFSVYAIIATVRYVATGSIGWVSQMLRVCSRIIALTAVFVGQTMAHAADATLTLACQGTTTSGVEDAKPERVSMGIIVNFTNRTVQDRKDHPGGAAGTRGERADKASKRPESGESKI